MRCTGGGRWEKQHQGDLLWYVNLELIMYEVWQRAFMATGIAWSGLVGSRHTRTVTWSGFCFYTFLAQADKQEEAWMLHWADGTYLRWSAATHTVMSYHTHRTHKFDKAGCERPPSASSSHCDRMRPEATATYVEQQHNVLRVILHSGLFNSLVLRVFVWPWLSVFMGLRVCVCVLRLNICVWIGIVSKGQNIYSSPQQRTVLCGPL